MPKIINKERMIEVKKEEKYYQIYRIHLLNGEVIEASEEYDLPVEKGLVGKFQKADDNKIFEIGDAVSGVFYLLPSNIELSGLEVRLINAISRERVLTTCIS